MIDIGDEERNNVRIHLSNDIIGVDGYPKREDLKKEVEEIYGTYSEEIYLR